MADAILALKVWVAEVVIAPGAIASATPTQDESRDEIEGIMRLRDKYSTIKKLAWVAS